MILRPLWRAAPLIATLSPLVSGRTLTLDTTNEDSIKEAAASIAYDTMTYYTFNQSGQSPGKFDGTWWEGGALFMFLMQYWYFTGDTSYNPTVIDGMLWQAGSQANYMPANSSQYLGNDDQVFWALAAMTATELKFENPPKKSVWWAGDSPPSWLGLAQAVFNTQVLRWDETTCHGGLHWQIQPIQAGYNLKNSVSNGGLFQLAARLGWYTGNSSYSDWAEKIFNWTVTVPLMNNETWHVTDSTSTSNGCSDAGNLQWTYNYGIYMYGAAYMYNLTGGSALWSSRYNGLLDAAISGFFPAKYNNGTVMSEYTCENGAKPNCDRNQVCFKGLTSSWMAFSTYLVAGTYDKIMTLVRGSAEAAVGCCTGGSTGTQCGTRWWDNTWDGTSGIEQGMSVLSVVSHSLVGMVGNGPVTSKTGGDSLSQPGLAGNGGTDDGDGVHYGNINTSDRAGAGILTALVLIAVCGGAVWIII